VIRLGKYCRFEEEAVVEWYRRKYSTREDLGFREA
jgi:hypothetical protein